MIYDGERKREDTLKKFQRAQIRASIFQILIFFGLYVCTSFYFYMDTNPKLLLKEVIVEHSIDALIWNHEKEKLIK